MIRTILRVLLGAATLSSAVAAAQPAAESPAAASATAERLAASVRATLPHRFAEGETLVAAVAEEGLLVLTYEVPAGLARNRSADELARRFVEPFCATLGPRFFAAGSSLRIDTRVDGGPLQQATAMTACPPKRND